MSRADVSAKKTGAPRAKMMWLPCAILFALTFALRLWIAHGVAQSPILVRPALSDGAYLADAQQIEASGGFGDDLPSGSPLYGLWLSALPGKVKDLPSTIPWTQALVDALTAAILFAWIARRFGARAGIAAGALFALDPLGGVFAARLIPVSLGQLVLVTTLALADRLDDGESLGLRAAQGIALGLGTLLLPLPFLALLVLFIARLWRGHSASRNGAALLLLAPVVLLVGIFVLRNATAPDGAAALDWTGGIGFYRAWDPETGGTMRTLTPPSWQEASGARAFAWESMQREGTNADAMRFYWVRGFQRLLENPIGTAGVLLSKAAATLGAAPVPDQLSPGFLLSRGVPMAAGGRFSFALLLALGLAGFFALRRERPTRMAALGCLAVGIACLLGPTSAAARQPAAALLAGLAGAWLLGPKRDASVMRIGAIAGAVVLVSSIALGALAPASALQNPSEDLRLLALSSGAQEGAKRVQSLLSESLRADPKNLESRVALASAYLRDQLNDAAQAELDKAYAVDSTHVSTLFSLSRLAQGRGENEAAAEYMAKVVNLRPGNPLYLNELGQLLVVLGRISDAKQFFVQALRLKPDYQVARTNLEAIEAYEQNLESSLYPPEMRLSPDDPVGQATPDIVIAMERQDWARADSLLDWAERTRPDLVIPHWLRAGYYGRRGETAAAIAELETCLRLAPARPTVVQLLASLYVQTGNRAAAERLVAASLIEAKDDPVRVQALEAIRQGLNAPVPSGK